MKINKILFFAFIIFIVGCVKAPTTGSLQFSIIDDIGNPAANASVFLYNTENDFFNNRNLIASQVSDNNGVTVFTNLNPQTYYYFISRSSDCANNDFTPHTTLNSVSAGTTVTENATINETGQLNFNNASADPYKIYINGNYWGTVNGNSSATVDELVGTYSIEVRQASGFVNTPNIEDFNATVKVCSTGNVNFP